MSSDAARASGISLAESVTIPTATNSLLRERPLVGLTACERTCRSGSDDVSTEPRPDGDEQIDPTDESVTGSGRRRDGRDHKGHDETEDRRTRGRLSERASADRSEPRSQHDECDDNGDAVRHRVRERVTLHAETAVERESDDDIDAVLDGVTDEGRSGVLHRLESSDCKEEHAERGKADREEHKDRCGRPRVCSGLRPVLEEERDSGSREQEIPNRRREG